MNLFTENDGKNIVYGIASNTLQCGQWDIGKPAGRFAEVFSSIDFIKDVIVRFQNLLTEVFLIKGSMAGMGLSKVN